MTIIARAIASGSNGNSFLIFDGREAILIDNGISFKKLSSTLRSMSVPLTSIKHVLVTHAHSDHVRGLPVFHSRSNFRALATHNTLTQLELLDKYDPRYGQISKNAVGIEFHDTAIVGGFEVTVYPTFHDIPGACGYHIRHLNTDIRISYSTDTAGLTNEFKEKYAESEIVVIESNHDLDMLKSSRRPPSLKKRIRDTHMNNFQAGNYLQDIITENTQVVFYAHLSGECNSSDLVANLAEVQRIRNEFSYSWIVCERHSPSTPIEFRSNTFELLKGGLSSNDFIPSQNTLDSFFT